MTVVNQWENRLEDPRAVRISSGEQKGVLSRLVRQSLQVSRQSLHGLLPTDGPITELKQDGAEEEPKLGQTRAF